MFKLFISKEKVVLVIVHPLDAIMEDYKILIIYMQRYFIRRVILWIRINLWSRRHYCFVVLSRALRKTIIEIFHLKPVITQSFLKDDDCNCSSSNLPIWKNFEIWLFLQLQLFIMQELWTHEPWLFMHARMDVYWSQIVHVTVIFLHVST